ncbi:hypothetical protein JOM56_002137 [Amanita muscaria]
MGVGRDLTYLVNVNDDLISQRMMTDQARGTWLMMTWSLTYNSAGRDSPSDLVGAGRDLTYLASDDLVRIWMEIIAMTFTNVSAKGGSTCQFGGRRVIICARHIAIACERARFGKGGGTSQFGGRRGYLGGGALLTGGPNADLVRGIFNSRR